VGAFAQDKWRVNSRATVSMGLRYDVEIQPIQEIDNAAFADPNDYPTGPSFFQLDLRAGYRVRPTPRRTIDAFVEVFNATNRANFDNPTGDRRLTDFLNLTTLRAGGIPTTVQLGVRFEF
jgi:outer membrane receptor protein involved in Fe transport